jgi:hypothetical protein
MRLLGLTRTWQNLLAIHVESLSPHNCKVDYIYFLAKYMYRQKSEAKDAGSFSKCIEVVLP